jgi:hypothetical protein
MYGRGAGYQASHYMSQNAYWEMGGDYRGTFRGSYDWYAKPAMETGRAVGTGIATLGGMIGGYAAYGATAGAVGGPWGVAAGLLVGAAVGVGAYLFGEYAMGPAGAWVGGQVAQVQYGLRNAVGGYGNMEFRMPFVNTRAAHTMRQAGLQSMMMSTANYRTILGKEASYLH